MDAFTITMTVLILLNVTFHSSGCYLLLRLFKNGQDNVQQIYLINLSVTHTLGNILQLLSRVLQLVDHGGSSTLKQLDTCIMVILLTVLTFSYYMSMAYITLDKALEILLNIKYPVYWNEQKAKRLVYTTWVVGVCMPVCVLLMHHIGHISIDAIADVLFLYICPTFDFSFTILAVITYSFLFQRYRKSRVLPTVSMHLTHGMTNQESPNSNSIFKIFRKSNFYITVLLILSFLIFMVLPNMVYLFYGVVGGHKSKTLDEALLILYNISYLLDAWIYIFAQQSVRNLFYRKLRKRKERLKILV